MRLSQVEMGLTALIIVYIAFYTHPAPSHISDFVGSPVGSIVSLLAVLYVTVYKSLVVGIFLAIAYLVTVGNITEYLDPKEQKPEEPPQPKSAGVSAAEAQGVLKALTANLGKNPPMGDNAKPAFKGDTKLPTEAHKKGTHQAKPAETTLPKATPSKTLEHFASW
jgi:hypothetical protein